MKKLFNSLFIALAAVALSSCSGLLNSDPMDKADTYKKALDVVKEKFDAENKKIYQVRFSEGEPLTNKMMYVDLFVVDSDNNLYSQAYYLDGRIGNKMEATEGVFDLTYQTVNGIDLSKIDLSSIEQYFAEAQKFVPEGHTYKSIGSYLIEEILPYQKGGPKNDGRNIGEQDRVISILFTEDGNETETKGREITYLYYEGKIHVNPDGTMYVEEE